VCELDRTVKPSDDDDSTGAKQAVKPFRFTTADIPADEQFDAWREHVRAVADLSPRRDDREGCPVELTSWDLGRFVFCQERNPGAFFQRTRRRVRATTADHWYLFLLKNGRNWTESDNRDAGGERISQGRGGQLGLYSLGEACHGEMADIHALILFVPRDLFPGIAAGIDRASNTMLDKPLGGLLADYLLSLEHRLPDISDADLPNLAVSTRAMVAACLAPSAERAEEAEPTLLVVRREQARRLIRGRLLDPRLTPSFVARVLGLSRSELYRVFEGQGGVAHYIQKCRLTAAHDALSDPTESRRIHEIAEVFGFADGPSFSRVFHRHFGYRPSDVRHGVPPWRAHGDAEHAARAGTRTLDTLLRSL
jgi:AraC-like DNA-binding protein